MHVVQMLLPLYDNDGRPFPDTEMAAIREDLVAHFGGVTATRTPSEGVWAHGGKLPKPLSPSSHISRNSVPIAKPSPLRRVPR